MCHAFSKRWNRYRNFEEKIRGRPQINYRLKLGARSKLIVPVAVERVAFNVECRHFLVADLTAFLVLLFVEAAVEFQSLVGSRRTNKVDHNLVALDPSTISAAGIQTVLLNAPISPRVTR